MLRKFEFLFYLEIVHTHSIKVIKHYLGRFDVLLSYLEIAYMD